MHVTSPDEASTSIDQEPINEIHLISDPPCKVHSLSEQTTQLERKVTDINEFSDCERPKMYFSNL